MTGAEVGGRRAREGAQGRGGGLINLLLDRPSLTFAFIFLTHKLFYDDTHLT